ncbi:MAG: helix-turn-helix domain-containing protein, partial [Pseudonocardiaceae bacterium]
SLPGASAGGEVFRWTLRTIGWRLRRVRDDRDKSLRVISGLARMSKSTLSRIERGERSPTLNELVALADALQISVSELTRLPVPAPAHGHTDSTTTAIGLALDAIKVGHPGGLVLPVAVPRDRVARFRQYKQACRFPEVAAKSPGLVRDVHTTLATGADRGKLLELAMYPHVHVTETWLILAARPMICGAEWCSWRDAWLRSTVRSARSAGPGSPWPTRC